MKINIEFDLTPAEFRQAMGLPDVEGFQQELMSRIQKQMDAGVDGYDPMSLMEPFLKQPYFKEGMAQGMANLGSYQQMMFDMLRQAGSNAASRGTDDADTEEEAAGHSRSQRRRSSGGTEGQTSSQTETSEGKAKSKSSKGSASATSRSRRS